jgi:hypothetical protein
LDIPGPQWRHAEPKAMFYPNVRDGFGLWVLKSSKKLYLQKSTTAKRVGKGQLYRIEDK